MGDVCAPVQDLVCLSFQDPLPQAQLNVGLPSRGYLPWVGKFGYSDRRNNILHRMMNWLLENGNYKKNKT